MKYAPPLDSTDPNAGYNDPVEGTVPAAAVEQPMREIASVIQAVGLVPSETDLTQLDQAIDLKVAAVQPDLGEFVTRDELAGYKEEMARYQEEFARYVKDLVVSEKYDLCEFYYFRNPVLRPGFMSARGELLENAVTLYPEAWAFLHTEEGQDLCVSEEEWQAMSRATFATLANGGQVGWNGIGGVPFFAPDSSTGNLRLPDLRGMYAEAAGFDALDVGGVHGDAMRNVTGFFGSRGGVAPFQAVSGAFWGSDAGNWNEALNGGAAVHDVVNFHFSCSRMVPTANKNQPRAWGALACVYLGRPAS